MLELIFITCLYEMHAVICRALRLEYDDIPERVVEVPAPSQPPGQDFMAGVELAKRG